MSMYKYLKNIFLGIIFLCIFIIPTAVNADYDVKGDTSKSINNLSTGSYYTSVADDYLGTTVSTNLYNSVETTKKLDVNRLGGLKIKLKDGGSSVDIKEINIDNVYPINTRTGSIFIYKKPDGTEVIIGLATSDNKMYIPKDPILKDSDSVGPESLDPKTGNGFLNLTDQDRGLAIGTTVNLKNKLYNLVKEQEKLSEDIATLDVEISTLEEQMKTATEAQKISISRSIEIAKTKRDELARKNTDVLTAADSERARRSSTAAIDNDQKCNEVLEQFTFYCMAWNIAKFTNVIFKLTSFVAYVAGTLFDYSLELSMNSAEFFEKLGVVEITWSFIRDILNITFIFILLWTAIQILLGNDNKYNAKKVLMNVVIFAILINFSLFAAKLMVDGSNVVSLKIYEAMKSSTDEKSATISERVMKTVGLSALYDITQVFQTDKAATMSTCATNPGALITISVMGSIFLLILSLALGLAAALFLIRLVNILILFIKSPLWVWGYVLPGNSYMTKIRNDWWNGMKHVLTFPIMYMFWMLVAIIVFSKLGQVNIDGTTGERMTLINLICNNPGSKGFGSEISLVAIFFIVIIFMMQAIKYGVNHATTSEQSFGGDLGKKVAGKFGSWQDGLTTKLHKTSWNAAKSTAAATATVAGAGIGAAKHGLTLAGRTGVGFAKGLGGEKGFKEGFSEGFLNPGINSKEWLRDKARTIAANNNNILGDAAAKFANKYNDPKNSAGQTRKQVEEKRVAAATEKEKLRTDAIDKAYKIVGQKEWMKRNSGKTVDDYEKHVVDTMAKRTDALFGKNAHQLKNKDGKTHIDQMREAAVSRVTDKDGNIQIKFKESAMHDVVESIIKHHTDDGAGVVDKDLQDGKKRFELLGKRRSAARIKAISDKTKRYQSEALTKDSEKKQTENQIQKLKDAIDLIENLPDEKAISELIANNNKYTGKGDNEKTIRELNKAIENLEDPRNARDPDRAKKAQERVDGAKSDYIKYLGKQKEDLIKKQNVLAEKIKKEAEASENKDKK